MWAFSLYPEAGEGGGCLVGAAARLVAVGRPPDRGAGGGGGGAAGAGEDPPLRGREPAEPARHADLSRARAATIRCSCAAIWRGSSASCARGLAAGAFPYVWVPQWHPGGHGLHAHFAVGRFVPRGLIERLGARLRAHQAARRAAGRLGRARRRRGWRPATWLATSAATSRTSAGWRGCTATRSRRASSRTKIECYGASAEDVIERASRLMGSEPERVWLSVEGGGVAWAARLLGAVELTS